MEFTEEKKNKIEQEIVNICVSGLENNSLTEEQMGDISFFVLERIDLIKTQDQLIEFLERLHDNWSIFGSILEIEKGQQGVLEEKAAVKDVEQLIKDGDIDQAIQIAKTANGGGV